MVLTETDDKLRVCKGIGYYRLGEVNRGRDGFILQCNWCILITQITFCKIFFEVIAVSQVIAVR